MSVTHSAVSQHIKQLEAPVGVTLLSATAAECASRKKDGSMPCKSARRYSTSPTPRAWCRSNPAPRSDPGDAPLLWLPLAAAAAGALSGAASADRGAPADQPAVVNLQQEGIDLAIRMGQGDWEGMESRRLFADEQLVVAAPGYRGGNLPTTAGDRRQRYYFSMESWNARCSGAGKPIVPAGLRLNDSNLVLEAVRTGRRGAGAALLGGGGDSPRRAGAAHRRHRPLPRHYWLTVSPQAENRPEVARFIARLEEEIALWRQQISV